MQARKSQHKKDHMHRDLENRTPLGVYDEDSQITIGNNADKIDPILPPEIWCDIEKQLDPKSKAAFAQVSRGTYALGCVGDNSNGFYNHPIRQRRKRVQQLLDLAVREAQDNQNKVEEIIRKDISLLLEKGKVTDKTCGFKLTPNGDSFTFEQTKHIQYEGSLYQIMLRTGDTDMCNMIKKVVTELKPELQEKLDEQYKEVFDKGINRHVKTQEDNTFDFSAITDAISKATPKELNDVLAGKHDPANNKLCKALDDFRNLFDEKSLSEKSFNRNHLLKAMEIYIAHRDTWVGSWDNPDWRKLDIFWRQVIGYAERFLPTCDKQAFAQGLHHLTKETPDPLMRDDTIQNCVKHKYELWCDLDPYAVHSLGLSHAVYSFYGARGLAGVRSLLSSWRSVILGGRCFKTYVKQKQQAWENYAVADTLLLSTKYAHTQA